MLCFVMIFPSRTNFVLTLNFIGGRSRTLAEFLIVHQLTSRDTGKIQLVLRAFVTRVVMSCGAVPRIQHNPGRFGLTLGQMFRRSDLQCVL